MMTRPAAAAMQDLFYSRTRQNTYEFFASLSHLPSLDDNNRTNTYSLRMNDGIVTKEALLKQQWASALTVGYCCGFSPAIINGCISSSNQYVIHHHHGNNFESVNTIGENTTRIHFTTNKLRVDNADEELLPNKSTIAVFANQPIVGRSFFEKFDDLAGGGNINVGVRAHQMGSTYDTETTTIYVYDRDSPFLFAGRDIVQGGKEIGGAAYTDLNDPRLGRASYSCGTRLRIITASSVTYPKQQDEKGYHKMLNVAGYQVFDGNRKQLRDQICTARTNEVLTRVKEAMDKKTPVLVQVEEELIPKVNKKMTDDYCLCAADYDGFRFYFSPVLGHWCKRLIFTPSSLLLDLDTTRLRNGSGVMCCIDNTHNNIKLGYGQCQWIRTMENRIHGNRGDVIDYIHGLGASTEFSLPDEGVEVLIPKDEGDVVRAIQYLTPQDTTTFSLDLEFGPKNKQLGTMAFGFRRHNDNESLDVVLILLLKQKMGEDLFNMVVPHIRNLLCGHLSNSTLVTFDWRNDLEVLVKSKIIDSEESATAIIDLKETMGDVFPLMYRFLDMETEDTELGLKHFVEMCVNRKLSKENQVANWHTMEIQESKKHINYALLDAYAILLVYEDYIDRKTRQTH